MDSVSSRFRADIDQRVACTLRRSLENTLLLCNPKGKSIDQNIGVVAFVKINFSANCRHAHAVAVAADPCHHTVQQIPSARMIQAAKAQGVQRGDRARPHGEDISQNASHAGRRPLIRFDKRGMVVALDFKHCR